MGIRQEVAFMRSNEIFKRLEKVTSVAALTPEERRLYEADLKNTRDTLNQIRTAEEKGIKIGRAEGRAEGEETERRKSIRLMLSFGVPAEKIAEEYGISPAEVIRMAESY